MCHWGRTFLINNETDGFKKFSIRITSIFTQLRRLQRTGTANFARFVKLWVYSRHHSKSGNVRKAGKNLSDSLAIHPHAFDWPISLNKKSFIINIFHLNSKKTERIIITVERAVSRPWVMRFGFRNLDASKRLTAVCFGICWSAICFSSEFMPKKGFK